MTCVKNIRDCVADIAIHTGCHRECLQCHTNYIEF